MQHLGTTRKQIFEAVVRNGFSPEEFDYVEEGSHIVVTHRESKHQFIFDRGDAFESYSMRMTMFTPSKELRGYRVKAKGLTGQTIYKSAFPVAVCIEQLSKWLIDTVLRWKTEAGMPDPWKLLESSYENIDKNNDDEPLSEVEAGKLKQGIKSLPKFLVEQYNIKGEDKEKFKQDAEQVVKTVTEKIDRKESKKQIRQYLEGAVIEMAIEWGINQAIDNILPKFLEYIQSLLSLPMPPGL